MAAHLQACEVQGRPKHIHVGWYINVLHQLWRLENALIKAHLQWQQGTEKVTAVAMLPATNGRDLQPLTDRRLGLLTSSCALAHTVCLAKGPVTTTLLSTVMRVVSIVCMMSPISMKGSRLAASKGMSSLLKV